MGVSLNTAPNEIILSVVKAICNDGCFDDGQVCKFLASLSLVNRHFYSLANPMLYQYDAASVHPYALTWAVKKGDTKILRMSVQGGASLLSCIRSHKPFFRNIERSVLTLVDIYNGRPVTSDTCADDYNCSQQEDQIITKWKQHSNFGPSGIARGRYTLQYDFNTLLDVNTMEDSDDGRLCACKESALGYWRATPLHLACFYGHQEVVRYLLDQGVDLDAPSRGVCSCMEVYNRGTELVIAKFPGWTPLHTAICAPRASDMSIAKMLLEAGAKVETEPTLKETALHTAAHQGRTSLIKFLVQGGYQTNVNVKDSHEGTPVHYAYAGARFCRTIPLLVKYGADIDAHIMPQGRSLLAEACEVGKYDEALMCLDLGADPSRAFADGDDGGLLHCCFQSMPISSRNLNASSSLDHGLLVDRLLASGVDPNQVNGQGSTPLMWAAKAHSINGVQKLLAAGAKIDLHDSNGSNALMWACAPPPQPITTLPALPGMGPASGTAQWQLETIELAKILLNAGVRLEHRDNRGRTAFHNFCEACGFPATLVVAFFIDKGATVSSTDKRGHSVLRSALLRGSLEICDVLLRQCPGVQNIAPEELEAALDLVLNMVCNRYLGRRFHDILGLLMTDNVNVEGLFEKTVTAKNWYAMLVMMRRALVPPASQSKVNPFCHLPACRIGKKDEEWIVKELASLGYNVDERNCRGETPLFTAVERQDYFLAEQLLKLDADVHTDNGGLTPLSSAIESGRHEIVEMLLKYTSIKPGTGTPQNYLHIALKKTAWLSPPILGRRSSYVMLLEAGADPNAQHADSGGDTPLMVFLKWLKNHQDTAELELLVERVVYVLRSFAAGDVDINTTNHHGKSTADLLQEFFTPHNRLGRYVNEKVELVGTGQERKMKFKGHNNRNSGPGGFVGAKEMVCGSF